MKKSISTQNLKESLQNIQFAFPKPVQLLFIWAKIGISSFGGGAATQYLIQEQFIYRNHWITQDEYSRIIGMCQLAPGINILSYTIVIGEKFAGPAGVFTSLLGLVLPSASIAVALTALYTLIRQYAFVHSALQVAYASVFGITVVTNWRNMQPIFKKNVSRGSTILGITIAIAAGSGIIYLLFKPSVILLYLAGGFCGGLAYWFFFRKRGGN